MTGEEEWMGWSQNLIIWERTSFTEQPRKQWGQNLFQRWWNQVCSGASPSAGQSVLADPMGAAGLPRVLMSFNDRTIMRPSLSQALLEFGVFFPWAQPGAWGAAPAVTSAVTWKSLLWFLSPSQQGRWARAGDKADQSVSLRCNSEIFRAHWRKIMRKSLAENNLIVSACVSWQNRQTAEGDFLTEI